MGRAIGTQNTQSYSKGTEEVGGAAWGTEQFWPAIQLEPGLYYIESPNKVKRLPIKDSYTTDDRGIDFVTLPTNIVRRTGTRTNAGITVAIDGTLYFTSQTQFSPYRSTLWRKTDGEEVYTQITSFPSSYGAGGHWPMIQGDQNDADILYVFHANRTPREISKLNVRTGAFTREIQLGRPLNGISAFVLTDDYFYAYIEGTGDLSGTEAWYIADREADLRSFSKFTKLIQSHGGSSLAGGALASDGRVWLEVRSRIYRQKEGSTGNVLADFDNLGIINSSLIGTWLGNGGIAVWEG